jgi:outer membrane receptor protein involved in Fe transport
MTLTPHPRLRLASAHRFPATLAALTLQISLGQAQTAPSPVTAADVRKAAEEQSVQLTPFEVKAESDNSYGALNSNSITRFNTELSKLPVSADIMSKTFMDDIGAVSIEAMISTYSGGGGFANFNAATGAAANQPGENNSPAFTTLRGLTASTTRRDGFMSMTTFNSSGSTSGGYTSNFDIERVEIINGPQSLLYGNGGAGGVVNIVSKRAQFRKPAFGSFQFRVDESGNKTGLFDFGVGTDKLALRYASVRGFEGTRRTWIGGHLGGFYAQVAWQPFRNMVIRLNGTETTYDRITPTNLTLTALNAANDARNGQFLRYLLASDQITRSASGPSGAGVIANGKLTWDNVDSLFGWRKSLSDHVQRGDATIENRWTKWLSTQLSVGILTFDDTNFSPGMSLFAPNATANPQPGHWTVATTAGAPTTEQAHPSRTRSVRFSLLSENSLFRGRAHSQTSLGVDYERFDLTFTTTQFYRADGDFKTIVNPASAANNGRTLIPLLSWAIDDGPLQYPINDYRPGANRITLNGVNYNRESSNPFFSQPVTEQNPLGVTLGGASMQRRTAISRGIYGANSTDWLDGRLNTLLGFRLADSSAVWLSQGSAPTRTAPDSGATSSSEATNLSYSAGVNYALLKWLRPYVSVSDSYNSPLNQNNDPYGKKADASHAVGEEIGVKMQNATGTISGSIAAFNVQSRNEQYSIVAALMNDINPNGLNGRFGGNPGAFINIDRKSRGVQVALTATPADGWRMRLSAAQVQGTIGNTTSYAQVYNDQFYANAQGQVTYRDGTPVYVLPTFNAAMPTVASTAAGAMPLTIAMMNTPSSAYYANPTAITGQINAGSNAGRVLSVIDPTRGPILTGVTGLPITQMQINPGFKLPGDIRTSTQGDRTSGYPELSFNFTNVYTFREGWARGIRLGGSALLGWRQTSFYYFPAGVAIESGKQEVYRYPDQRRFDLIAGYTRKFGRLTFSTQLNVSNLFNRYRVIIVPNITGGWAGPLNATFDQQPRSFQWTNTIAF